MKLATFNVNSLKIRLPIVLDWLATHQPDAFCLQELKGLELPETEIKAAGYHIVAVPQKAYNGVAIITKQPVDVLHTKLPGMEDDEQARFIAVRLGNVELINIYAPNGNPIGTDKYAYKMKWLNALYDYLVAARVDGRDVAIMGDFNIIPEPMDAAHPENWTGDALFQDEVRALYRAMMYLGYTDALRVFYPGPGVYSFWDYQAGSWQRNNGIRIDHGLFSPRLADRLIGSNVDRDPRALEKPSDHTPVVFDLTDAA